MTHPYDPKAKRQDGYLRIATNELDGIRLVHLFSGVDGTVSRHLEHLFIPSVLAGYTEWFVPALHASLGWDWYLDPRGSALKMAPWDVRSNLMLTQHAEDLGNEASETIIRAFLRQVPWRERVRDTLDGICIQVMHDVSLPPASSWLH